MVPSTNLAETNTESFLIRLEQEAARQSKLAGLSIIPNQLHGVATFIALHVWQVCLFLALATSIFLELVYL